MSTTPTTSKKDRASMFKSRRNQCLMLLLVSAILFQCWIVWHATHIHDHHQNQNQNEDGTGNAYPFGMNYMAMVPLSHDFTTTSSTTTTTTTTLDTTRTLRAPRVLIGIMGNANNHMGLVYRNRHRQLFQLWNDTRLCPVSDKSNNHQCQIYYTFILGGHNASVETVPTYHLGIEVNESSRPLTLDSIPILPRYKDVMEADVTILNIRENMNEGKTPTFIHWASIMARQYDLDYIMKCDSDTMLRWNAFMRFVHAELPWATQQLSSDTNTTGVVPKTVLGNFCHKAKWTSWGDETLWQDEWYQGMHLYLAGQLYLMSVDVAESMVVEARNWYTPTITATTGRNISFAGPYFAGHEDHDALSMIQQQIPILRWMSFSKHYTFWEHPVKGDYRWERILQREQRQDEERRKGIRKSAPIFPRQKQIDTKRGLCSLVIIWLFPEDWTVPHDAIMLETMIQQRRDEYLSKWKQQQQQQQQQNQNMWNDQVCSIPEYYNQRHDRCQLYYVFVVGTNPHGLTEMLEKSSTLEDTNHMSSTSSSFSCPKDVWCLNMKHNVHHGMGTTILYFIETHLDNYEERFDTIVLLQSHVGLHLNRWNAIIQSQIDPIQPSTVVMGEMRDKYQQRREFPSRGQELFWYQEYDEIHLYLGNDCIVLGTKLISNLIEQAQLDRQDARSKYVEFHLGHDLTTWAYFIPKTILHWIPIPKSQEFWYNLDEKS